MQTTVYAVYAKLNSILDFTDYINQTKLLTKKSRLMVTQIRIVIYLLKGIKECCIPAAWTTFAAVVGKYP